MQQSVPRQAADKLSHVLSALRCAGPTGEGTWMVRCPAHDDAKPSLSVRLAGDHVLVHCHAGCQTEDVLGRCGLSMTDLFLGGDTGAAAVGVAKTDSETLCNSTAHYDYRDEGGECLYRVVRRERDGSKSFAVYRLSGPGRWTLGADGVRRVLYRLPELIASSAAELVWIVEGEKDADRLAALGFVATTNPFGAVKWLSEFNTFLHDRHVAIIPDNDEPGRKHASKVAESLAGVAASIRVVSLPGLPAKGDVGDYLDLGRTKSDLLTLLAEATEARRTDEPKAPAHLTDAGNAIRLAQRHGADLRYCHQTKSWLVWNEMCWAADETGEVMRRAKETARSLYEEVAQETDDATRGKLRDHARVSEGEARLRAMIALAQSEPVIPIRTANLNCNPWKLNVLNGTIDLSSGDLLPHSRVDYVTKLASVTYDPTAACPRWETFLDRTFGGDSELVAFVRRVVGYALTGSTREQALFILFGTGANGKSTFLEVLRAVFGDYAMTTPSETLLRNDHARQSNDIARLAGARLVTAQEVESGARLAEALVKQMTGGDMLAARLLYAEFTEFRPVFKLFLATNHKPSIRGTDNAIWRRVRLIPFSVTIPADEQDKDLAKKLTDESPGILAWAVRGALEWQRDGLGEATAVSRATLEYRDESDILGPFIAECCVSDASARTAASKLYASYIEWASRNGERPTSQRTFGEGLAERGFLRHKSSNWHWLGLRLRLEAPRREDREGSDGLSDKSLMRDAVGKEAGEPSDRPSIIPMHDGNASPPQGERGDSGKSSGLDECPF